MSTHATSSDVNNPDSFSPHNPHTPSSTGSIPVEPRAGIPMWLVVAFIIIIVAGGALIFGRERLAENAMFDSMKNCDAKVYPELRERGDDGQYSNVKPNGLVDGYGLVRINKERENIAALFSLCDRADPAAGLRLFRRAFTAEGNKQARLVALFCANYLAHSQTTPAPQREKGVLEAEDINRILDSLDSKKEPDADVRKAALHALSDLTVITNPQALEAVTKNAKAETPYSTVTDLLSTAAKESLEADSKDFNETDKDTKDRRRELKIALHKDAVNGIPVVLIRWSTPGLALAWWKTNATGNAKWDKEMQRFVFP